VENNPQNDPLIPYCTKQRGWI